MNVLAMVWFATAIGGCVAGLLALAAPAIQRPALLAGGSMFAVAGVLGILSIGIIFVALAAICFSKANRSHRVPSPDPGQLR